MTKVRINNLETDGPVDLGIRGEVTRYANAQSYANKHLENGFTYAKVWFLPGEIEDVGMKNVAFASYKGIYDLEAPMATFSVEKANGEYKLKRKLLDKYPSVMQEWASALQKENGNYKRARERVEKAAITNSADIDATKNLNILSKVLGLQSRSYFLNEVVTEVPAPNLVFSVDTFNEGSANARVGELTEPKLQAHTESRATKVLYKNVGHIAISEEARLKSIHNTMGMRQEWTMRDMLRILNAQIAAEIETATAASGNDWGAIDGTYFRSTKKPHDDLQSDVTTIRGNGFNVDWLAMHDRPAQDLVSNDFVKGPGSQTSGLIQNNVDHVQVIGLPLIVIDQALTNTKAWIGSKEAVWLGKGPVSVASYNNDVVGYEGWLVKQYVLPFLANSGAIRGRTGVSA